MITEFFVDKGSAIIMWFMDLLGEFDGLPTVIETTVGNVNAIWTQGSALIGALNQWLPMALILSIATVGLVVEVAIAVIRGLRVAKQLVLF